MPQARTPNTPAAAAATDGEVKLYEPSEDAAPLTPDWLIARAMKVEHEIALKLKERDDVRSSLRKALNMDALNEQQADFVDDFYPFKAKGEPPRTTQENERTKKLRAAVLKREAARAKAAA